MEAIDQFERAEHALLGRFGVATEARRLVLNGSELGVRVLESGAGDPVVFVHGGGAFAAEWAPLLAELAGHRCLAVDRPGCGGSDPFDYTDVDLRRHAVAFLDGLLDALSLERAAFVGQSMGALWSLWLALERPERVSSLALLGAPALILGSSAPLPLRLLGVRGLNRLLLRLDRPSPKQAHGILEKLFGAKAVERMTPEFVETVYRAQLVPGAELAWRTLLERVVRARGGRLSLGEGELRRIEAPALFVWGSDDAFAGPEYGRRACELIPRATLEVVAGGHGPWWDEPKLCGELVSAFLSRAPGRARPSLLGSAPADRVR
jgi:pimeloyl-ACP methyl ester carboxylesterase